MESKEVQTSEKVEFSLNIKPSTQSEGVQTTEQKTEKKTSQNNFYISYKDLFINTEKDKEKEKEKEEVKTNAKVSDKKSSKNEEDIKMIHQLFNIPTSNQDSFKNKDFKFRFINNKNITFVNEFTVKYTGKGISKIDYGIVQTEKEIVNKRPVFYYEANIINDGKENDLLIGIGEKNLTEKCIQLGLTTFSFGYHSKGKSYNNKKNNKYGETFAKGDIIGCGVDFIDKSIFYTKNGKFLDYAFKEINFELNKDLFYPSICMHSLNIEIQLNFGKEDFKFDINNYYENILIKKYNILQSFNPKYDDMDYLVKEYLFHEGYMNTFKSMIKGDKKHGKKKEKKENGDKMEEEDDNDDLYLDIDDNLKIEETKNKINLTDEMEIEEDDNNEELLDNIIELLPKDNTTEEKSKEKEKEKEKTESKKDKKEEKKEDKKEDKKDEKKEDKTEEKKEEKKEENKEDKKEDIKEEKKEDKKEENKEEKKDEKKDEKKEEKIKIEAKMEIEEQKEKEKEKIKEKTEEEKLKEKEKEKLEKEKLEKEKKEKEEKELKKKKEEIQKFLTLRNKLISYLSTNEFDKAILLLKEKFSSIKEKEEIYKKIFFSIIIMKYLTLLTNENNYITCFELLDSLDKEYWDKYKILLYENNNYNKTCLFSLQSLATLISQPDITNSEYAFYLNENQIDLIKNQINSLLFELINLSPLSNLNKICTQLEYMNELYNKVFNCNQELSMKLE